MLSPSTLTSAAKRTPAALVFSRRIHISSAQRSSKGLNFDQPTTNPGSTTAFDRLNRRGTVILLHRNHIPRRQPLATRRFSTSIPRMTINTPLTKLLGIRVYVSVEL